MPVRDPKIKQVENSSLVEELIISASPPRTSYNDPVSGHTLSTTSATQRV